MGLTSNSRWTQIEVTSDLHRTHIGLSSSSRRTRIELTSYSHRTHAGHTSNSRIQSDFCSDDLSADYLGCHVSSERFFLTIPQRTLGLPSGSGLTSGGPTVGPTVGQSWTGARAPVQRWTGAQDLGRLSLYNMKADPAHRRRSRSRSRKSSVRLAQRQKHDGPRTHPRRFASPARTNERTIHRFLTARSVNSDSLFSTSDIYIYIYIYI